MRCERGRFLLTPSPGLREIFIGVLARAQSLYPVRVHAFCCLSNHFHLLVSADHSRQLAEFMRHVNTNLSKEAGRLHDWSGAVFERRYQAIPVSEEEGAQIERLRYILAQGTKAGLVARPREWPGAHSTQALLDGSGLEGVWYSRTREYNARRRRGPVDPKDFATPYQLRLEPLPCWRHLSAEAVRGLVRELVEAIEIETAQAHQCQGTRPLGVAAILRQHPHQRPARSPHSPAPLFHAASKRVRQELRAAYAAFLAAFREAAERLRAGESDVRFPEGAFPPPRPFVLPEAAPG